MPEDFATWLVRELEQRGWSRAEMARRGGISSVMVDMVVNGRSQPGLKFVGAVSRAFDMPEADVMQRAGWLAAIDGIPPRLQDVVRRVLALPEAQRAGVIGVFEATVAFVEDQVRAQ